MYFKNSLRIVLISLLAWSCAKEEVKLPINGIAGIQEPIYDNTQIWMFYEMNQDTVALTLNKNNKISSTNWVFNIDRRLPMRLVAPKVQAVVEGRKAVDEKTDKPSVFNYFSYVDTLSQKMSTIKFNRIQYRMVSEFPAVNTAVDSLNQPLQIILKESGLTVNNAVMTPEALTTYLATKSTPNRAVHVYMDGNLSYGDYIELKAILASYQPITNTSYPIEYVVTN